MAVNYAESWATDLLSILEQETLTSPFVTTNVKWLGTKTFRFTQRAYHCVLRRAQPAAFARFSVGRLPAYAVLWWPLSVRFAKKNTLLTYSVLGTVLTCALFAVLNVFTTPHVIWAVYPIFAMLWWPLSVYFYAVPRRSKEPAGQPSKRYFRGV